MKPKISRLSGWIAPVCTLGSKPEITAHAKQHALLKKHGYSINVSVE